MIARRGGALALLLLGSSILAGCGETPPPTPAIATPAILPDQLVGKWGLASYRKDEDRTRTIKEALAQCNKPYIINKGPNGGLMMYLADSSDLTELVLKAGAGGATYLGPPGDAGSADDRVVSNVDANSFTTIWVDPDNVQRYGTMVYERCGKR